MEQDTLSAQEIRNVLDSLYIEEIERQPGELPKVLHAEPLYIDLIRDLGARKGEKEWNVGTELMDKRGIRAYHALVEYEWAPVNRLGLELEAPFSMFSTQVPELRDSLPAAHLESLKMAVQHSFFVSDRMKTTLAWGYLHEWLLYDFAQISGKNLLSGHLFNPFFVAAKRWGQNFHTLVYAGPQVFWLFGEETFTNWQINSSVHYMIDGTRNFVGLELNKDFSSSVSSIVARPQLRVALSDNLMIGIVTGIPLGNNSQGISAFTRLIYEPGHRALTRQPYCP